LQDSDLDSDQKRLLEYMGTNAVSVDNLVDQSGLSVEVISSTLLMLELRGWVASQSGGLYVRCTVAPNRISHSLQDNSLDADQKRLLEYMGEDAVSVDKLVNQSGLSVEIVSSTLSLLELQGWVASQSGGLYVRCTATSNRNSF